MKHSIVEREDRVFPVHADDSFDAQAFGGQIASFTKPDRSALKTSRKRTLPTARLRNAIEQDELSLHYQPQYETRSGGQCGVEALARWFLPDGETIAPTKFVRAAEANGLISALGAWVLNRACSTVVAWPRLGGQVPTLCVNVSPGQISEEFSSILVTTLARTGFPPSRLELEITESMLIEQPDLALDCIAQWKKIGVRIALDDFGTGFCSLSYLSRLPVDRIKIDKSLIHRMLVDVKTAAIVRAVISLGEDLGVTVLAEGVETEAQLALLSHMRCQQVQGYLLAFPSFAGEAKTLLGVNWGKRVPHGEEDAGISPERRTYAT